MFDDDESVFTAMRAGARGYLLKGADQDEIVRAIRAAAAGEAIFGPEVAARVVDHFAAGAGSTAAAFPALTEREREVLAMIAAGKGNATIAHELTISLKTVRNHVSNIFTKLQVSDRSGAIVKARRAAMADDRPSSAGGQANVETHSSPAASPSTCGEETQAGSRARYRSWMARLGGSPACYLAKVPEQFYSR